VNALRLVLVTAAVLLAAQISGWPLLDRLFYVLIGLLALALGLSLLSPRGLRLLRSSGGDRGQVGQVFTEHLRLENASPVGKLWVEIDDLSTLPGHHASRVVALPGRGQQQWTVSTPLARRGRFHLGPVIARGGDPFGLFPVQRALPGTSELVVYPACLPLADVPLLSGSLAGGSATRGRTPHLTPNVAGLREYTPGDSFNRIAWSATARLGRMMVKEFDLDPTADVWLVLDMQHAVHVGGSAEAAAGGWPEPWRESTEEFGVVVAASLGQHFLARKRAVGLLAAGQHHEVIAADRGPRQLVKLLEALAVIRAEGWAGLGEVLIAEAARFGRHSTLVIITPATDERWLPALSTLVQGNLHAAVVLVEAATFGPAPSPLLLVSQLAAMRVPALLLKRHDDLNLALSQPAALPTGGPPPWRAGGR
jgi:uncharacterized protein (DUF58 family)